MYLGVIFAVILAVSVESVGVKCTRHLPRCKANQVTREAIKDRVEQRGVN